jgi:hypothetical protein
VENANGKLATQVHGTYDERDPLDMDQIHSKRSMLQTAVAKKLQTRSALCLLRVPLQVVIVDSADGSSV